MLLQKCKNAPLYSKFSAYLSVPCALNLPSPTVMPHRSDISLALSLGKSMSKAG